MVAPIKKGCVLCEGMSHKSPSFLRLYLYNEKMKLSDVQINSPLLWASRNFLMPIIVIGAFIPTEGFSLLLFVLEIYAVCSTKAVRDE